MTAYERYETLVRGEAVDVLPRLPILMAFAAEFIGSNYAAFASDYRVLAEANLACAERFGFDQLSAISDPFRETQGFGAEIDFPENSVPRCVAPPLANDKDMAQLAQPDPHTSTRMRDRVDGIAAMKKATGNAYSILGWVEGPAAEAADLRGVSEFLMDLMMDPDYACALMDRCVAVGIDFAKAQIEAGADTIGVGDAIASQVSPATYEAYIFERERQLIDGIHGAGGRVRLHICGDTTHLLPWFAKLGCDIVDLDWQVDIAHARDVLGHEQAIMGNIDPVSAVLDATPEAIRAAIAAIYARIGNRYVVGAGCEIPPGTPHENLEALCAPVPWQADAS